MWERSAPSDQPVGAAYEPDAPLYNVIMLELMVEGDDMIIGDERELSQLGLSSMGTALEET